MKRIIEASSNPWRAIVATVIPAVFCLGMTNAFAEEHEEEEDSLDVSEIFFELNDTDGDLGIHGLIDGDAWKRLQIFDHNEQKILDVNVKGRLRKQGLTEIFFESAEPPFETDDPEEVALLPEEFFARFPEGTYAIETKTVDGEEQEGEAEITHIMPAPPEVEVNGEEVAEDCDAELPEVTEGDVVTISWEEVTMSHPEIGTPGEEIEVVNYEVVVEIDESPYNSSTILPPGTTEFIVPTEILELVEGDGDIKFEVLVREASYNQTAVESCFTVVPL